MGPQRCSLDWRELVDAWLLFVQRCGWNIGEGDFSFWFDNWNKNFAYQAMAVDGYSNDKLRDFWDGEQWNFYDLLPTLGQELVQYTIERAGSDYYGGERCALLESLNLGNVFCQIGLGIYSSMWSVGSDVLHGLGFHASYPI